ncbi:MAG: tRNA (5-methylaminomethyl-2-thiouridylate)-methyltransferase [uncultured bacterium]|nr:MAG: tRNA (5-methylaminomethyl-2-thiouridylate)-methyltransferase [uncultured bacterium]
MKKKYKKILVGMSGGVDSSVVALLLQKEGYEAEGVFIDFIGGEKSERDFQKAKKIADKLKISIDKIDAREIFQKEIIDKFVADYKKGITPNPCVFCNPEMKFKILIKEADKRGINKVATGHYARVMNHESLSMEQGKQDTRYKIQDTSKFQSLNLELKTNDHSPHLLFNSPSAPPLKLRATRGQRGGEDDCFGLSKARDDSKDQSYFLYRLTQEQLSRIIFPLGDYLKSEVRKIAEENNFGIKDEEESQDVCFIADNDFNKFISEKIPNKPGKIVDNSGKVLGTHQGLHFYTIGQRKGINLGGDGPYFVVKKNLAKNNLIVANNFTESLWRDEFEIKNVSWINPSFATDNLEAKVKIRYRTEEIYAIISEVNAKEGADKIYKVKLDQPQKAITPGQSAVFYSKEGEVLGGGVII